MDKERHTEKQKKVERKKTSCTETYVNDSFRFYLHFGKSGCTLLSKIGREREREKYMPCTGMTLVLAGNNNSA